MSSPNIPNDMQNQQQQQNVQGGFRCPRCYSYNNLCHRCLSFSSIYNLRYYCCKNCRRPPWTLPIGRHAHNITTGNINRNMNRWIRRLTFSAVSASSSSTAALPTSFSSSSSSSSPAAITAAGNAGSSSSMFTDSEPSLSNWLPQPSMARPVVKIPRPPALPQQQIPNIVQIYPRPPTLPPQQIPNIFQIFPRPPTLPQQQIPNIFQIFPRPPALPQNQNPNMGITVTKNPAVCLDLSLRPPERSSNIPQKRQLPFDLNMAPPPDS